MSSTDLYYTIENKSKALYKEKGSKFIGLAFPVNSESEIKELLTSLRKKYHDARHHCYAYRLGAEEPFKYRINDDGEPSGTAGKPIYGQLLSKNLTNVLLVVVRYFGGTLLGASGLMRAYKAAASECLQYAAIIEKINFSLLKISFPYECMNLVMRLIKDESLPIFKQTAEYDCQIQVCVPKTQYKRLKNRFLKLKKIKIDEE